MWFDPSSSMLEPRHRWWVLAAMALGLLAINLDFTVVNLSLAQLQSDLGASVSQLQWVMNAYALALAGTVVIAGRVGDVFGRRRFFLLGAVVFALAAVGAALAPNVGALIAARAVQGIGGATLYTLSLAILGDAFPPEERGRALGIWTAVAATGIAAGPLVGGAVVEAASWRWIFVLLVPFAVASIAITFAAATESRDETAARTVDTSGAATSAVGLVALSGLFVQSGAWGFASGRTAGLAAVAAVALTAFVVIERRVRTPLVDLELFLRARFLAAAVTSFALAFVAWAALFFAPLYFQHTQGHSALASGLLLLPCTVLWSAVSLGTGRLVARVGTWPPMAVGLLVVTAGLAVFSGVRDETVVLVALGAVGFGIGLAFAPMTAAALNAVPTAKAGVASGALLMARMVGATFGVATCGAVFQSLQDRKTGELGSVLARPELSDVSELLSGSAHAKRALASLPADAAGRVLAAARDAFSAGLTGAMALAAAVAALGAALVVALGRR